MAANETYPSVWRSLALATCASNATVVGVATAGGVAGAELAGEDDELEEAYEVDSARGTVGSTVGTGGGPYCEREARLSACRWPIVER